MSVNVFMRLQESVYVHMSGLVLVSAYVCIHACVYICVYMRALIGI